MGGVFANLNLTPSSVLAKTKPASSRAPLLARRLLVVWTFSADSHTQHALLARQKSWENSFNNGGGGTTQRRAVLSLAQPYAKHPKLCAGDRYSVLGTATLDNLIAPQSSTQKQNNQQLAQQATPHEQAANSEEQAGAAYRRLFRLTASAADAAAAASWRRFFFASRRILSSKLSAGGVVWGSRFPTPPAPPAPPLVPPPAFLLPLLAPSTRCPATITAAAGPAGPAGVVGSLSPRLANPMRLELSASLLRCSLTLPPPPPSFRLLRATPSRWLPPVADCAGAGREGFLFFAGVLTVVVDARFVAPRGMKLPRRLAATLVLFFPAGVSAVQYKTRA